MNFPYLELINTNLQHGVSPGRLCSFLEKNYKCPCSATKLYKYRSEFYPGVHTDKQSILIEDVNQLHNPKISTLHDIDLNDIKDMAMQLNFKCGNTLLKNLKNNEKVSGNIVQLYASTLRTILSMSKENEVNTSENLSELVEDETILMLNDWSK